MTDHVKRVTLDELSVSDILLILSDILDLCLDQNQYIKFGKDLKSAWEELKRNPQHKAVVLNALGIKISSIPEEAPRTLLGFFNNYVTEEMVEEKLKNAFPAHWWKDRDQSEDREYQLLRNTLSEEIKKTLEEDPCFGMELTELKPSKSKTTSSNKSSKK